MFCSQQIPTDPVFCLWALKYSSTSTALAKGDAVARNREQLQSNGITHVVNCAAHICSNYFEGELTYRTMWLTDTPGEDMTAVLYDSLDFIDNAINNGGRRSQSLNIYVVLRAIRC
eukprot:4502583-Pyramimonas_sp.AAC.1